MGESSTDEPAFSTSISVVVVIVVLVTLAVEPERHEAKNLRPLLSADGLDGVKASRLKAVARMRSRAVLKSSKITTSVKLQKMRASWANVSDSLAE